MYIENMMWKGDIETFFSRKNQRYIILTYIYCREICHKKTDMQDYKLFVQIDYSSLLKLLIWQYFVNRQVICNMAILCEKTGNLFCWSLILINVKEVFSVAIACRYPYIALSIFKWMSGLWFQFLCKLNDCFLIEATKAKNTTINFRRQAVQSRGIILYYCSFCMSSKDTCTRSKKMSTPPLVSKTFQLTRNWFRLKTFWKFSIAQSIGRIESAIFKL